MAYLNLLQRTPSPIAYSHLDADAHPSLRSPTATPKSYLEQLLPPVREPLSPGSLAGRTQFARAYNALLPQQHRFFSIGSGKSRGLLHDGREVDISVLVELAELCAEADVAPSIDTIRRVAMALAYINPAADPWEGALKGWLADAASLPPGSDTPVARITLNTLPHWFISMRDIKAELDAYGGENVRRVRLAMKTLGWRERRAFAWGRRMLGFVRLIDRPAG